MLKRIFTCAIAAFCFVALPAESKDYTQYVDPCIRLVAGSLQNKSTVHDWIVVIS